MPANYTTTYCIITVQYHNAYQSISAISSGFSIVSPHKIITEL